jgi:hypothetical protein
VASHTAISTLLLSVLLAPPLAAQALPPAAVCPGGRISYVHIDNGSIFDPADPELDQRFLPAYRLANRLHVRTREAVIRRELLFGPGSCHDPELLEDTERLLRSYEFLGRVDIFDIPQPDGSWHVVVSTRDEWSTRLDLRVNTRGRFRLEGGSLVEENLLGTGQSLGLFYHEREVTRDYGVAYFTPQFLGTRWDLRSELGRTRAGTVVHQEIAYPFVGEAGRWAGRESFRREDQFFDYVAADSRTGPAPHVLVPMREQHFDLAFLRRVGRLSNMGLAGAAVAYQQVSYPGRIELSTEGSFDIREPAPDSLVMAVLPQRQPLNNIRAFLLLGHRNVWWVRRRGLDSMRGQEDVRLGAEAVLALGRSIPALEVDDDVYLMLGLYTAMRAGDGLFIARGRADARRDQGGATRTPEWEDLYVEAELLTYVQTRGLPRQTFFGRAAFTGGWNTRTPFQLTLGGEHALRGLPPERLPGGRRLVLTLEDRFLFGSPRPALLDLGGTLFLDVGRMWAGDTPFGAPSGWRAAGGVGLRSSFPAGSRSTYRLDFAWPLERDAGLGDLQVSLSIGELRGILPRADDRQLVRSRTLNVAGDLFTFRHR